MSTRIQLQNVVRAAVTRHEYRDKSSFDTIDVELECDDGTITTIVLFVAAGQELLGIVPAMPDATADTEAAE
jgi:hypothetical protein